MIPLFLVVFFMLLFHMTISDVLVIHPSDCCCYWISFITTDMCYFSFLSFFFFFFKRMLQRSWHRNLKGREWIKATCSLSADPHHHRKHVNPYPVSHAEGIQQKLRYWFGQQLFSGHHNHIFPLSPRTSRKWLFLPNGVFTFIIMVKLNALVTDSQNNRWLSIQNISISKWK